MIGAQEVHHLEGEEFLSEVGGVPKLDQELDVPKRESLDSRNDSKEGGFT